MDGRRRALIVANDEYDHEGLRHLRSPAADAEALGQVLSDGKICAFEVQTVHNEPSYVIQTQIEDLLAESRPDDVVLLHFSCHGLKSESGELFFAARNTRPNRLSSSAISADFVRRCMRASRSRSIVLLLDCCYGGAVGWVLGFGPLRRRQRSGQLRRETIGRWARSSRHHGVQRDGVRL